MNTLETLQDILVKDFALDAARVTADADLNQLGIDSLNLVDFVFKIEDRLQLEFKEDMPTGLVTLGDVVQYVDALIAKQAPATAAPAAQAASV